jgi:hypothetical protein
VTAQDKQCAVDETDLVKQRINGETYVLLFSNAKHLSDVNAVPQMDDYWL